MLLDITLKYTSLTTPLGVCNHLTSLINLNILYYYCNIYLIVYINIIYKNVYESCV